MEAPIDTARELLDMQVRLRVLRKRLDVASIECACCGLTKYNNRAEHNAAAQIDGAIGRLEKVVETIAERTQLGPWIVAVTWIGFEDAPHYEGRSGCDGGGFRRQEANRLSSGVLVLERDEATTFTYRRDAEAVARVWATNGAVIDATAVLR